MTSTFPLAFFRRHSAAPLTAATLSLALLAGCGSSSEGDTAATSNGATSTVKVATKVADDPCALLSRETLAKHFSVPVDEIEQIVVASTCQWDWKNKTDRMEVSVTVSRVADDAARVRDYFDSATRSMSGQEVSDAMAKVGAEAEARGQKSDLADGMAGAMGGKPGGKGIQFEDVSGIGDKARLQLADGRLNVLYGNLYFDVTAYHGPKMPMPDTVDLQSIGKLSAQWVQDTMPQRKAAAEQIAKAVIAGL